MSRPEHPILWLSLALALAVWPLRADAQGTAPGPPPPSCNLLSKADAEAILGKPIEALGPLEFGPTQCAYTPAGERFAVMMIGTGAQYATAAEFYQVMEESAARIGDPVERRSDLGEAALLSDVMVWIYANRRSAFVRADTQAHALAAARKMVERLGAP